MGKRLAHACAGSARVARTLEILAVPSAVLCRRSGCSRGQQRLRASPNVFSGFREIVGPLMKKGKKKCRSLDFVVVLFSIVFALSRNATKCTARIVCYERLPETGHPLLHAIKKRDEGHGSPVQPFCTSS